MRALAGILFLTVSPFAVAPGALAQTRADLDWRRVKDCASLRGFVDAHGSEERFAGQITAARKRLCVPPKPKPTPTPTPAPRPPRRYTPPPSYTYPPAPAPMPTPLRNYSTPYYLPGAELASLYRSYYFCYGYQASDRSCTWLEEHNRSDPGIVTIWTHNMSNMPDDKKWAWGNGSEPRIMFDRYQQLTLESDGLCWNVTVANAMDERADAYAMDPNNNRRRLSGAALADARRWLQNGNNTGCAKYHRNADGTLTATSYSNGALVGTSTVTLFTWKPLVRVP